MKGNSDITATAIFDAALICVYLTMTLSKAALKCPPAPLPRWASRVFFVCGCGEKYSRVMKGNSDITATANSDAALMAVVITSYYPKPR